MDASFVPRSKRRGIMDEEEEEEDDDVGSMLSLSGEGDEGSTNSVGSSSSDFVEDATSSSGSSSSNSIGGDDHPGGGGPLFEMSSLISHLPFKRGLSKHFQGKSQSFTSFASVRSLEDLVKPERPFRKKLKSSKSYAGGLDAHTPLSPKACSRAISKKGSRGSFSSLTSKRQHSLLGSRPPVPPHRSGSCLTGQQALLFA